MSKAAAAALVLGLAVIVSGAAAPTSGAAAVPDCRPEPLMGPAPFQAPFREALAAGPDMQATLTDLLGGQFVAFGAKPSLGGWIVAVGPVPYSLDQAEAAITTRIRAAWPANSAAVLVEHLHLSASRYGGGQLVFAQADAQKLVDAAAPGIGWSLGIGCNRSDDYRVEIELYNDATADQVAAVRSAVASLGDLVVVTQVPSGPPTQEPPFLGTRLPRDARLPASGVCVRGAAVTLGLRQVPGHAVRVMRVTIRGHTFRLRREASSGTLRVPLAPGRNKLEVTLTRDGRAVGSTRITVRRCPAAR